MLDMEKIREREKRLLQQKAKVESDLARAQKKLKDAARREDTRRKIVLGGALLAAIDRGTISTDAARSLVTNFVAARDRKLFEGGPFAVAETQDSGVAVAVPEPQE
ncbi:hypothetical protein [Aliihoeflea aestuarii]|uniref:hypothetical protein n=1 Tax=Aliihoeflea aestuarii TaxID=453840 RepID=UPI0020926719|nr:hypothetical protein [Aliihoeflea aestuarii]